MTKKQTFIALVVIVLAGAFLRLVKLSDMPPSLNWDEVSHGYNAYSILKTGSDEWGVKFPLANFRAYGDYPLTLNLYLTTVFVSLFGLTTFALRLPHALLGIGTILASTYFAYGVTKKRSIALLVAFLVAIDPWYLFTSRFVLQSNLSVFLLTLAMALFTNRKSSKWFLPLSFLSLGLTLFSYHTTRIFSPLLLLSILILFRKTVFTKLTVVITLLFFLPLPFILLNPDARARSTAVFLLNDSAVNTIENARNNSQLPFILQRVIYNRPVFLIEQSISHYIDYFSPQFLFFNGGTQYQFSVPDHGLLFPISMPFFYIGVFVLVYRALIKKQKTYQLLLFWLVLAPIPASITVERFAVLRSTAMLPLPELLTAIGLIECVYWLKKRKIRYSNISFPVFMGISVLFLTSYLVSYFGTYKQHYSWAWQYGYKDVVSFMSEHYNEYDRFIVTKKYGEPHEFILFYTSWNPSEYKLYKNLVRYNQSNWWWVDSFDKYVFVNDWQIPAVGNTFVTEKKALTDCSTIRCALVSSVGNAPEGWKKIKSISFLDGENAFEIYENY
jgi:4-amino-4-deoxy-L-arabinose transferase-like glycosyltransferase